MLILDIVSIVSIGLLVGTEFAVSAFINPMLARLDEAAQATATRLFAVRLGTVMPFWYAASFILLIAEAVLRRHTSGTPLLIAAIAIWAAAIVLSVTILVPINNRIIQLDAGPFPAEARRAHARWESFHRIRVAALTAAMVCAIVAVYR
ncbi:MAG: DUF1772 domain-containing protein [Acidobacteriota bacterium]